MKRARANLRGGLGRGDQPCVPKVVCDKNGVGEGGEGEEVETARWVGTRHWKRGRGPLGDPGRWLYVSVAGLRVVVR